MKVTPCGRFSYQNFPLIDGNVYDLSEEEKVKLRNRELEWSTEEYVDKTTVIERTTENDGTEIETIVGYEETTKTRPILIPNASKQSEDEKSNAKERIAELKSLLASTDYKCLKFVDGELTEQEYAEIKAQRHAWREEINRLEESL